MSQELKLKTVPMGHQQEAYDKYRGKPYFALFWDQGTGKTKTLLDMAAYAYHKGVVDCLIVIAPNGVHANWVIEEIPKHLAIENHIAITYYNGKGKKWEKNFVDIINEENHRDKLKVICFSVEGFSLAKKQKGALEYLLKTHKCYGIIDEADDIANPMAKRTKYLLKLSDQFKVRRIATGTPVDSKPLAAWAQMRFLSPNVFMGQDYFSFRARYSIMKDKVVKIGAREVIQKFPVAHRNLDKLGDIIRTVSDRVLKEDCMDLPEKVYKSIPIEMAPQQAKYYKEMLDRAFYVLAESDDLVYAKNALDMMGKLSRITGGFAEKGVEIKPNRKLNWVSDNIDKYTSTSDVIIWCRYRDEIEAVVKAIGSKRCAVVHGGVLDQDREDAIDRFKNDPDCDVLVTNRTMSRGHTLVNASTNFYYSNDYSLRNRRQSEDRTHRKGQTLSCLYIDLVCVDTVDEKVLETLKLKKDVSDLVLGDPKKAWVQMING